MSDFDSEEKSPGLSVNDYLAIAFKHQWKIIFCTLLGLMAAVAVYLLMPPVYESEAKLFIPYVVDRTLIDTGSDASPTSRASDAIMNSEVQILKSYDLMEKTIANLEAKGIAFDFPNARARNEAPQQFLKGLDVEVEKGMNVIAVRFHSAETKLPPLLLEELIANYREKSTRVHRFPESLNVILQRRDQVKLELTNTEDELKRLKAQADVLTLEDSTSNLSAAFAKAESDLKSADVELRAQAARLVELEKLSPAREVPTDEAPIEKAGSDPSMREIEEYQSLGEELAQARAKERKARDIYVPGSSQVQKARAEVRDLQQKRQKMEEQSPGLVSTGSSVPGAPTLLANPAVERARLAALKATTEELNKQVEELRTKRTLLADIGPKIARAETQKAVLEENYKNIETSLGKAENDKALNAAKVSNIGTVQEPSPGIRVPNPKKKKVVLGFAGGGLAAGLGLAFFIELMLNRTVRRISELEWDLQIPVLLSIPFVRLSNRKRLANAASADGAEDPKLLTAGRHAPVPLPPWSFNHFIRPFCEAIRDRMVIAFELQNVNHKPKLIGVTGFSRGAGTSTIAGGLAAALSETGDGKVLLVDMNVGEGEIQPFLDGKSVTSLSSILEPEKKLNGNGNDNGEENGESSEQTTNGKGNLVLATVDSPNARHVPLGLRRFYSLMPRLRAADFDYIIFDMPAMGPTSPTLGMLGVMDKVLLVLESDRSDKEAVKRSYAELIDSRANVACVFNKAKSYGPSWLQAEAN